MTFLFTTEAKKHYEHWRRTDPKAYARINALLSAIRENPFGGVGKPEPLRGQLRGFWSRRITREHRLVYRDPGGTGEQLCEVIQCKFHY